MRLTDTWARSRTVVVEEKSCGSGDIHSCTRSVSAVITFLCATRALSPVRSPLGTVPVFSSAPSPHRSHTRTAKLQDGCRRPRYVHRADPASGGRGGRQPGKSHRASRRGSRPRHPGQRGGTIRCEPTHAVTFVAAAALSRAKRGRSSTWTSTWRHETHARRARPRGVPRLTVPHRRHGVFPVNHRPVAAPKKMGYSSSHAPSRRFPFGRRRSIGAPVSCAPRHRHVIVTHPRVPLTFSRSRSVPFRRRPLISLVVVVVVAAERGENRSYDRRGWRVSGHLEGYEPGAVAARRAGRGRGHRRNVRRHARPRECSRTRKWIHAVRRVLLPPGSPRLEPVPRTRDKVAGAPPPKRWVSFFPREV